MNKTEKLLIVFSILIYLLVFIFSYAYVDLNLTLSQNKLILFITNTMQQLGYYNRPLATIIYISLLFSAFGLYILNLIFFYKQKITLHYLKVITLINTVILIFAYPFLSSDLFNYIFDAKIILNYHVSPYTHRPMDFPGDDWLRFMRWVHRYSPYGPLWLAYSLIPAFLGFGKFIINFLTFKIFISIFHLINSYLIYKILKKIKSNHAEMATAFYALNPTLLLEGVVSAHNDVVLATFLILPIYLYTYKQKVMPIFMIVIGTLIKYIPILNIPWLLWAVIKKREAITQITSLSLLTLVLFTYFFSSFRIEVPFVSAGATQVQFQPWYLFWTLPYIALLTNIRLIAISIAISFGASLRYLPFLYYGDWSHMGTTQYMQIITFLPVLIVFIVLLAKSFNFRLKKTNKF